jgi:hypothetical protein
MAMEDLVKVAERQVKNLERRIDEQDNVDVGLLDAFNRLLNTYRRLVQASWIEKSRRY